MFRRLLFVCFCLVSMDVYGESASYRLSLGVEGYHVKRSKSFGTKQGGTAIGGRLQWERIKRYGWYLGLDGFSSRGTLNGHTGSRAEIRSHLIEKSIEGRFGYTFQCKEGWRAALTPFAGGGWFEEKNNFVRPSPLTAHFKTRYPFVSFGGLFALYPSPSFMFGLNWKSRYPLSPKCRVTHDPNHTPVTQRIGDRIQYRLEMPFIYQRRCLSLGFEPFYESRIYGGHPNYPFDYIKTRFVNIGGSFSILYIW